MLKKLLNKKMKLLKNQQGLTLIELLVVIVILGIIAAIAIPAVVGQTDKAEKNADAQTLAVLKDALKRHQAVEGDPANINALVPDYVDAIPSKCADGSTDAGYALSAIDSSKDLKGTNITVKSSCPK